MVQNIMEFHPSTLTGYFLMAPVLRLLMDSYYTLRSVCVTDTTDSHLNISLCITASYNVQAGYFGSQMRDEWGGGLEQKKVSV
jgi:hypothetical protein